MPLLVRLAGHVDPDVRYQVARSLPSVSSGDPAGAELRALIRLSADTDAEVRDWAACGLGTLLAEADTAAIRAALWDRTSDDYPGAREVGICGLARRRDPRAVSLITGLLAAEDGAHVLVFGAARRRRRRVCAPLAGRPRPPGRRRRTPAHLVRRRPP